MATAAQQQQFTSFLAPLSEQIAQATGNSPQEILGQLALESGWGQGNVGTNNPGSLMPGGSLASYGSLSQFATAYEQALQSDGMTGYANNPQGFAQAAQAYDPGNPNYPNAVLKTIDSVPTDSAGVGVQVGNTGMNTFLPVLTSNSNAAESSTADLGVEPATGENGPGATGSGCSFSLLDFPSWLKCEGFNLLFLFLGLLILGAIIMRQLGMAADDVVKALPMPPVE